MRANRESPTLQLVHIIRTESLKREFLLKAICSMGLLRNKADPCVYFKKWTAKGLMVIWASWVNNLISCGNQGEVVKGRQSIKKLFDLDEVSELKEYVGCKIKYNKEEGWMKLTQPVLIQSFEDEFELLPSFEHKTPAAPGSVLTGKGKEVSVNETTHGTY